MSIDTQELRAIVERMTPGEWRVLRDQCHFDTASDIVCGSKTIAHTCSNYPQLEHDAAGIVALKNAALEMLAEIERLREALERVSKSTGCVDACPCWAKLRRQARGALGEQP